MDSAFSASQRRNPLCLLALALVILCASALQAQTTTQNFGSVALNASTFPSISISFQVPFAATPRLHMLYGVDFSASSFYCADGSGDLVCTVPVTFNPKSPGLRQDAAIAQDAGGGIIGVVPVSGIGLGPQLVVYPGLISTTAGTSAFGNTGNGGPAASATFGNPQGLAVDGAGNVYVADSLFGVVRKINASTQVITTVAGNPSATALGDGGLATNAKLTTPVAVTIDPAGDLYIADLGASRVRRVDAFSGIISTVAGSGLSSGAVGDGGAATSATIAGPKDVAIDSSGNLFIADTYGNRIRKVDTSGNISTVAGGGSPGPGSDGIGNGGPAVNSVLNGPSSVAFDSAGDLYVADTGDNLVRVIRAGIISVAAGNGSPNYSGDGQSALNASMDSPRVVRVDASGAIFVADSGNDVVRRVDDAGVITTFAGQAGQFGSGGDGGVATSAQFNSPAGLAVGSSGSIYVADEGNRTVRLISPWNQNLAFPSTSAGAVSSPDALVLENAGNQPLTLTALSIPANFVQQSSGAPDCTSSSAIAASESCSLSVAAMPERSGALTGTLSLTSNSLDSSPAATRSFALAVNATGTGTTPALSQTNLNFNNQPVQSTSSAQIVTLTNPTSSALTVTSIFLSGTNAPDFSAQSACGTAVPGLGSCLISVTFTPSISVPESASLTVLETVLPAGAPVFTQSILLTGKPSYNLPGFTVSTLDFGTQLLNGSAITQQVTFSNPSPLTWSLGAISLSGASDFSITNTTCGSSLASDASCLTSVAFVASATGSRSATLNITDSASNSPQSVTLTGTGAQTITPTPTPSPTPTPTPTPTPVTTASGPPALQFIPITPCRVLDTRNPSGPFGGPEMTANSTRNFALPAGSCAIPASAAAYSLNVTAVPSGALGYLSIWPTGQSQPPVSTLNSDGRIKANAVIVGAGSNGAISIFVSNPSHVIVDVNGYFVPAGAASALAFYPLTPCRVVDTRSTAAEFGGPSFSANETRSFQIPVSNCGVPANSGAYSLNFTVVPHGQFGYLSTWPAGQTQPLVSTLNAFTGVTTANAAIVPAGIDGGISVYVTHAADLIIDINGYFATPGSGGLSLYSLTPCRTLDTRNNGAAPFAGTVNVPVGGSCDVPGTAEAYVMNATVVPASALGFLALWPDGLTQPDVSTLNAFDQATTSNMAIVPAANDAIDAYVSSKTQLILDINGYFAP